MSAESTDVIDRRDFVLSSLATVGASAALVAGTEAADGQTDATPVTTSQGSIYTGDVIQGKKVVTALDVGDLQPGQKHLLYFQGVQMPTGQHWYVSVIVRQRSSTWQAHRPDQRRAWRRD